MKAEGEQNLATVAQGEGGKHAAGALPSKQQQPATAGSNDPDAAAIGPGAGKRVELHHSAIAADEPLMHEEIAVTEALARWLNDNQGAASYPEYVADSFGPAMADALPAASFGVKPRHWVLPDLDEGGLVSAASCGSDAGPAAQSGDVGSAVGAGIGGRGGGDGSDVTSASAAGESGVAHEEDGGGRGKRSRRSGEGDEDADEELSDGSSAPHSKWRRSSVHAPLSGVHGASLSGVAGSAELKRELEYIRKTMWMRWAIVVDESLGMFETVNGGCLLWCGLLTEGLPKVPALSIHIPVGYPNGETEHAAPRLDLTLAPEYGSTGFLRAVKRLFEKQVATLPENISISTALQTLESSVRTASTAPDSWE